MKVSIITVTYNSEKFLNNCIESVIKQDYHDIEYILIDGNSNDETLKIIQSYSNKITKWISEPDEGIYDAINKGIKLATGDLVGILNSDDYFANNQVISRIVQAFKECKTDVVYANVDFVANNCDRTKRHYSSKFFKPWMFKFGFQPAHPTFYTYRKNFTKYGFYLTDLKISGDFELLLRFLKGHKLSYKYINDTWVKMRTGGISTSGWKSILKLNREIVLACKINGFYTNYFFVYSKYLIKWWSFIIIKTGFG